MKKTSFFANMNRVLCFKLNEYKEMQDIDVLLNLIKAVKNHPNLFTNSTSNVEHDDFREWTAVAEECKITISEAQEQWNLLLLEYVEYLRNNRDFNLAQHMDFLQPYFFTINDGETIDEDELLNAIDSKGFDEKNDSNSGRLKKEEETPKASLGQQNNMKTDRIVKFENTSTQCNQMTQSIAQSNNQSNSFTNLSSLELIFLGYAKQLQKMPIQLQLKTKRKIADIMDEAEVQMMS